MTEKLFHYTGSALTNVYLRNGYKEVETPYGKGLSISNLDGLHRALAEAVIAGPLPMQGSEFRFLREELELSQQGLAELIGQQGQTVARWEKGASRVDPCADRLLRLIYRGNLSNTRLRPALDQLRQIEATRPASSRIVARVQSRDWHATEAAV